MTDLQFAVQLQSITEKESLCLSCLSCLSFGQVRCKMTPFIHFGSVCVVRVVWKRKVDSDLALCGSMVPFKRHHHRQATIEHVDDCTTEEKKTGPKCSRCLCVLYFANEGRNDDDRWLYKRCTLLGNFCLGVPAGLWLLLLLLLRCQRWRWCARVCPLLVSDAGASRVMIVFWVCIWAEDWKRRLSLI